MSVHDHIRQLSGQVAAITRIIGWAEEEISAARSRHPQAADRIWHSFLLLNPTTELPWSEPVYRAHCRELLERVAAGEDTRAATAAECCLVLSDISLQVPLRASAVGLYARMWRQAGLPPQALTDLGDHYEALEAGRIDDNERLLRDRLRQDWRTAAAAAGPQDRHGPGSGRA